jgi:hypothetical protein
MSGGSLVETRKSIYVKVINKQTLFKAAVV